MTSYPTEEQFKDMDRAAHGRLFSSALPPGAPLKDRVKYDLCAKIVEYVVRRKVSQRDLAKKLGVHEARVSELVHYKIHKFTADKLMEFWEQIFPKATVTVGATRRVAPTTR